MQDLNNLELILPLLECETEDDFYMLQLLKRRKDGPKVMATIPTPNGCHLITSGFNIDQLDRRSYAGVEIKKDNPTVLFVPAALLPTEK